MGVNQHIHPSVALLLKTLLRANLFQR